MPGNSNLHDSSRNKQDEFYTNLQLIEDELKHYRAHFKGKRVLCNCDDPYESNFFKYFAMSFNSLGLKSLTATCFATSPVVYTQLDLFGEGGGPGVSDLPKRGRGRARTPTAPRKVPYKIVINEFSIDHHKFENLTKEEREDILNYELTIYICEGEEREKLKWFEVVNTAGEQLNEQERRNAQYTGKWLYDAKKHFSKTGCAAAAIGDKLLNGSAIRQDFLETALGWIADRDGGDILDYMSAHQNDGNCDDLWDYFESVMNWVKATFPVLRGKLMKGLPWGLYFNKYGKTERDGAALEKRIAQLLRDDEDVNDITNQRGIYEYLLSGNERCLSIRRFSDKMARTAYERQGGKCKRCGKKFAIEDMQADHITPWAKGGKTIAENCQMLCADCNRRKSDI